MTLGTATQQKELTLDMLKSSLLHEEAQRKEHESNYEHKALVIEKNPNRGISHTRGPQDHVNNVDGRSTSRSRNDSKKDFSSRYYGGPNHYERDCSSRIRGTKRMEPVTKRKMTL